MFVKRPREILTNSTIVAGILNLRLRIEKIESQKRKELCIVNFIGKRQKHPLMIAA